MQTWCRFALIAPLSIGLAIGCKDPTAPTDPPPKPAGSNAIGSSGSGSAGSAAGSATAPAPVVAGSVTVKVNDTIVATVAPKDLEAWPRLDQLVPMDARRIGSWTTVTVSGGATAKPVEFTRPGDRYRDQILALYVTDGKPAFGIFDPVELAKKGTPGTKELDITEVKITADTAGGRGQNESGAGGGDPTKLVIVVTTAKGESKLTGEEILKLPREEIPNQDAKGWKLSALLAAAKVGPYTKVILMDEKGTPLPIEKKDFDDKTVIPFVKLNKNGQLRVRVYKQVGTGWQSTADLRGLVSIDVK